VDKERNHDDWSDKHEKSTANVRSVHPGGHDPQDNTDENADARGKKGNAYGWCPFGPPVDRKVSSDAERADQPSKPEHGGVTFRSRDAKDVVLTAGLGQLAHQRPREQRAGRERHGDQSCKARRQHPDAVAHGDIIALSTSRREVWADAEQHGQGSPPDLGRG
jgi:hypothetical protein